MRYQDIRLIRDSRKVTKSDLLILYTIGTYANDDGVAWPSISTIAQDTGYGHRNVQKIVSILEAKGYLSRLDATGGRGRSTRYRINLSRFRDAPAPKECAPVSKDDKKLGRTGIHVVQERAHSNSQKDENLKAKGWPGIHPNKPLTYPLKRQAHSLTDLIGQLEVRKGKNPKLRFLLSNANLEQFESGCWELSLIGNYAVAMVTREWRSEIADVLGVPEIDLHVRLAERWA